MATWTTKVDGLGNHISAAHINALQTLKLDNDGTGAIASGTTIVGLTTTVAATNNYCIGSAMPALTTGNNNLGFGNGIFNSLTSGHHNTGFGHAALWLITEGDGNACFGYYAGVLLTTGRYNTYIGMDAGNYSTSAYANCGIGYCAAYSVTEGQYNHAFGVESLFSVTDGDNNVGVGYQAGYTTTGSGNVFLGTKAGWYETGSNTLIIDNAKRASESDGRIKALVYGIFAAASADQRFRINGRLGVTEVPHYDNDAAAASGGLAIGEVYRTDADPPVLCIRVA